MTKSLFRPVYFCAKINDSDAIAELLKAFFIGDIAVLVDLDVDLADQYMYGMTYFNIHGQPLHITRVVITPNHAQ